MKLSKKISNAVAATAVMAMCHGEAFAQGLAGLDKAKTAAEDIKTGLYLLVGVVGLVYMIYLGAMAFTEKKSWSDFGWGAVHVSVVGGAVALGNWAWTLFA
jgi:hypothetical protein